MKSIEQYIDALPKAELHVHLFGTLTPTMLFEKARKNKIPIPYETEESLKKNFTFHNIASFVNMYDLGVSVFRTKEDFKDITLAYIKKSAEQNVKYLELIFDPQSHLPFGITFDTVIEGILSGAEEGLTKYGVTTELILCFVRHLGAASAMETLEQSRPYKKYITAVGLGGIEYDYPPSLFTEVYKKAAEMGYHLTAHCGEEAGAEYIWQGLNDLQLNRIDHGINCEQDDQLMNHLVEHQVPLTVCPVSNVSIKLFQKLSDHPFKSMLDKNLCVSLHSDDPSYFNSYINDVYKDVANTFNLNTKQITQIALNSFKGAFTTASQKEKFYTMVNEVYKKLVINN